MTRVPRGTSQNRSANNADAMRKIASATSKGSAKQLRKLRRTQCANAATLNDSKGEMMKTETAVANLHRLADFCTEYDVGPLNFEVAQCQVHISATDWPRLSMGQRVEIERCATWDHHTTTIDGVQVLALLKSEHPTPEIEVVENYQPV